MAKQQVQFQNNSTVEDQVIHLSQSVSFDSFYPSNQERGALLFLSPPNIKNNPKMGSEDQKQSPRDPKNTPSQFRNSILSPRFKSVAALAGWDEETLLSASLIVDDTPEREFRNKKRSEFQFKTPPSSSSRRKRRTQRSTVSVPFVNLDLDDGESTKTETKKDSAESTSTVTEEKGKRGEAILAEKNSGVVPSSSGLPCMDKLREELSCAICLDICFEPSTTPCGHSFCLKCLRSSASKCGKKCPKCRQLISNGRSCTVNTVLWNTIQLLFPQEVEARKAAGALNSREAERRIPETAFYNNLRNGSSQDSELPTSRIETSRRRRARPTRNQETTVSSEGWITSNRASRVSSRDSSSARSSSRAIPSQDEDAALALRLQREEFLGIVRGSINQTSSTQPSTSGSLPSARANQSGTSSSFSSARANQSSISSTSSSLSSGRPNQSSPNSFSLARANLRAMASRAITLRVRGGRHNT